MKPLMVCLVVVGKILKDREDPNIHHHMLRDNPDHSYSIESQKESNRSYVSSLFFVNSAGSPIGCTYNAVMSQENPDAKHHVSSTLSSGRIFTKKHASKVHLLPWQVLPSFYADADQSLEPTSNPVQHVPTLLEVCQLIFRIAPRAFDCKINALPS